MLKGWLANNLWKSVLHSQKLWITSNRRLYNKGPTRYKGNIILVQVFDTSISLTVLILASVKFTQENILRGAIKLPDMPYLTNFINSCRAYNICNNSGCDIVQYLIDIGVCFWNRSSKVKIFTSRILPREKCYSVKRILIKEINTIFDCKCSF